MTTESNVAIIIVNFNGDTLLTACVRSVLASTYPVTVYIIDNASQDKSIHYLQQAIADNNGVHIIKNPRNLGFAAATNLVLSQLKHEYYLLLNPDCFIQADTIAQFIH
ncbi:MAG: glycosyltransferase, partial [Pseudomonadota bacterium]|nr:glycosyltransferase [Pseudomonadota bacterium]